MSDVRATFVTTSRVDMDLAISWARLNSWVSSVGRMTVTENGMGYQTSVDLVAGMTLTGLREAMKARFGTFIDVM